MRKKRLANLFDIQILKKRIDNICRVNLTIDGACLLVDGCIQIEKKNIGKKRNRK
jgi:hypothetical protein